MAIEDWLKLSTYVFSLLSIPVLFFCAFLPEHVRLDLEQMNSRTTWVTQIPVPLLGLCFAAVLIAIQLPLSNIRTPRPMLMAFELSSRAYMQIMIIAASVQLVAARLMYDRRSFGWWMFLLISVLMSSSSILNLVRHGRFGFVHGQSGIAVLLLADDTAPSTALLMQIAWITAIFIFSIWVKLRHFRAN